MEPWKLSTWFGVALLCGLAACGNETDDASDNDDDVGADGGVDEVTFDGRADALDLGTPPSIDELTFQPSEGAIGRTTTVSGTIDFEDPDGDVAQSVVSILQPDGASLFIEPVAVQGAEGHKSGTVGFAFLLTPSQEGQHQFDVWLIDEAGNSSNRLTGTINVESDPSSIDCSANGICNPACADDPDCATCDCDRQDNVCNVSIDYTDSACGCDPDCATRDTCDDDDGVCDTYCHARDNDCPDDCNWYWDVCEAEANHSDNPCDNDPDCGPGNVACSDDGHCDTFCDPTNLNPPPEYDCTDPNCDEDADGSCD